MSVRPKKHFRRGSRQVLALLALAAGAPRGMAQYPPPDPMQPAWWDLNLSQAYLKVDAESEQESYSSKGAPPSKNQRLYLAPTFGVGVNGFLYHPDLINYYLLAEPGFSWQEQGPSGGTQSQNYNYLATGNGSVAVLQAKPYATTFNFDRSHEIHDYDFFNSAIMDVQSWGVQTGYREGAVPFTVAFNQSQQDSSGLTQNSTLDQMNLNVHARNERRRENATDLTYQFGQYDRLTSDGILSYRDISDFNYLTLTDIEHYQRSSLSSSLLFNQFGADSSDSKSLNGTLNYSLEHTPRLRSFYDYTLTTDSGGGADYLQNYVRAGLQHQLYESLTSEIDGHGTWSDSTSPGADVQSLTTGVSETENYSKYLGTWGHLNLGDTVGYDHTRQSSSGTALVVPNESHTLTSGQWVRLSQPRVISIISVTTDAAHGSQPLTENVDYYVDRSANPWQIQISSSGIIIHSGDTVAVTYNVQPNPSGSYSTLNNELQLRLDFLDNRLGIYARYNFSDNQADSPDFTLENINEFQAGADFNWHHLRLDAVYTDRQSSFYSYQSIAFSEGYTLLASARHSAGIDFRQQWSGYPNNGATNQNQNATFYSFTGRYEWHPTSRLSWSNEAGYELQRGLGLDQNLLVARSYLAWRVGKLDMHFGYEYQNQEYTGETRERNFLFLRMRRDF